MRANGTGAELEKCDEAVVVVALVIDALVDDVVVALVIDAFVVAVVVADVAIIDAPCDVSAPIANDFGDDDDTAFGEDDKCDLCGDDELFAP